MNQVKILRPIKRGPDKGKLRLVKTVSAEILTSAAWKKAMKGNQNFYIKGGGTRGAKKKPERVDEKK